MIILTIKVKAFLITILLTANIYASPIVIYDNQKQSKSITPYLPFEKPKLDEKQLKSSLPKPNNINFNNLKQRFPIITSNMQVGHVAKRSIQYAPNRALCLLGDDEVSINWLKRNYQFLKQINTVCLFVNIKSQKRFTILQTQFKAIEFQAISVNDIADQLGLIRYPVLIYQGSIEQ